MKFSPKQKRTLHTLGKEQNDAYAVELFYQLTAGPKELSGPKELWKERVWRELHR